MHEKFEEWQQNRHEYARDWKAKTGGKVLGYFCTYAPEEIVYAAGILPVRILGSHEPEDVSLPHIFGMFCPFCRDVLAQGLKGRYDYLDGIVSPHTCMHINQTFESWSMHVPVSGSFFVGVPSKVESPRARPYLAGELGRFKKSLEEWSGKTITNEDLDRAIEVYNTNRRLMRQIYELRRGERPPLTGADAMQMTISSQLTDKEEHNRVLAEVLEGLSRGADGREPGARLMILGSEDDDIEFLKMVESLDATFVIDDHCTGTRYFWNEVIPEEDRLAAIAARYLDRPPCPVKDWTERRRFKHILKLAQDYNVQGVIVIQQKFCDPHEVDIPPLQSYLEENGFPTYFLEFDVTVPLGPFRTRVEAFLETLGAEDLF
ncbi:MAG: benzoyl-CoA reductase, bzd-type, subunit N [Dehalococcoidia bacterium]